ncbi:MULTISPECIES: D-alanyl-lipoteichoic acid biosynthesis protein DltB [unclassified Lactococcus]|uniref:D-alanyl-lipoteichoic acid biosynthesis protein DltB n=1 Tax=unclassified Lactococcus TaxID=2643510 RepID=UPI0011C79F65|nr:MULTISPECIES: D-alanyl-lipoteichoic acid biosynthesis protein DltB [unclassified Lactococcus]MQW23169.1 D-alanyl-lipoteichoic acid biosynthesis protein DltB [Lactococcus sp. dk101]TXK44260.1 D-alanyl-lipoteichoic acid biosynthesis protein DltB [Lactococcus sp. dk310]TXK49991.1 D-alanyl-lipoteichoic acid biosynthesis protein DltB [Lactococcus sp. dk322]
MQPYSSPFYFVYLGLALLPIVIAHAFGKKLMWYQVLFTIAFLWLTFSGTMSLWALLFFGGFETVLIKFYEHYKVKWKKNQFSVFLTVLLLSIFPLFMVKLTPLIDPAHPQSLFGFLGISYVTFKTVNIILEIRDGLIKDVPLKEYFYFLYFFPTISSGPIDRFRRFRKEMESPLTKNYPDLLGKGIFYIFQGFLYKYIIGYLIDTYFLHHLAIQATLSPSFLNMTGSMYAYGLYLFFDFAGYSLFVIGVSAIMGYDIPHNFNRPFIAKNIKDFWNRWHMTLSFWFRDFVAMRLMKTIMVQKWTKNMVTVATCGYLASMGLMGFWHGFTWYYIVYGFYHAFLLIGYDAWLRWKKKRGLKIPANALTNGISIFITFNVVFIGFLIFSGIPNDALMYAMHVKIPLPNF